MTHIKLKAEHQALVVFHVVGYLWSYWVWRREGKRRAGDDEEGREDGSLRGRTGLARGKGRKRSGRRERIGRGGKNGRDGKNGKQRARVDGGGLGRGKYTIIFQ
jgi:hypothetical protein